MVRGHGQIETKAAGRRLRKRLIAAFAAQNDGWPVRQGLQGGAGLFGLRLSAGQR
jgi:hypothetical protein